MKVLLANPRCYCAGVDRAVKIVELALERFEKPVYVRKEIVHNSHVVNDLREKGAIFVEELSEVPENSLAIFSAHGVAPTVFEEAEARSLRVIDATCPLVSKVHLEVLRFVAQGYHIILIGREGHDEVIGTRGHSPNDITLVENEEQASTVAIPEHQALMVLTQTTLGIDETQGIVGVLRERFPHLEMPPSEDICYATQNRQNAVKEMCARGMDLLLVVGSPNSSNAAHLVEVGQVRGVRGFLIDGEHDIQADWLKGVGVVGVTGGASTPDEVVQAVVRRLMSLGGTQVERCDSAEESVEFQLPPILREAVVPDPAPAGGHAAAPVSQ